MAPLRTLPLLAAMAAFGLAGCSDNDSNPGTAGATPTITASLPGLGLNTLLRRCRLPASTTTSPAPRS